MTMGNCRVCWQSMRSKSGVCYECRTYPEGRALPKGQWVGGLVKKFVPDGPDEFIPERIEPRTLGVTCHCGCLLVSADETCPACLAWAMSDATRASWVAVIEHYASKRMEMAA